MNTAKHSHDGPSTDAVNLRRHHPSHRDSSVKSAVEVHIVTDRTGRIVDVCAATPAALNVSARGLSGRPLPLFFPRERPHLLSQLAVADRGHEVVISTVIQPRERQPRPAQVTLRPCEDGPGDLEWSIVVG